MKKLIILFIAVRIGMAVIQPLTEEEFNQRVSSDCPSPIVEGVRTCVNF